MTDYPFEWDDNKSQQCLEERGFDFSIVEEFDFAGALIIEDSRQNYGERRFRAFGFINDAAFAIVFTPRSPRIRIISVRRAHDKELKRYGLKNQS